MLDIPTLQRIRFQETPVFQRIVGDLVVAPMYQFYPGVKIHFEGFEEHVPPDRPVIYAMNHTDRYNYFPFQVRLYKGRKNKRYTATWVKGKYYEHPVIAQFMERAAQIPVPSRGYLIARDFLNVTGRKPQSEEYKAIRDLLDRQATGETVSREMLDHPVPDALFSQARDMLGRDFDPARHEYLTFIRDVFAEMMSIFVDLNRQALSKHLDIIVFPEGTRSKRLSKGHIGLAQMAMFLDLPIVPVGCNGSDRCYPGNSPIPKRGEITYRFGAPIMPEDMAPYRPDVPYKPFTPRDEYLHREKFQALVDVVMGRISELLDPEYRPAEDLSSDGVQGTDRFL